MDGKGTIIYKKLSNPISATNHDCVNILEGTFKSDMRHGDFLKFYEDQSLEQCEYKNDNLIRINGRQVY